jgi:hypothetical protein
MTERPNHLERDNDLVPQELRKKGWQVTMIRIGGTYFGRRGVHRRPAQRSPGGR